MKFTINQNAIGFRCLLSLDSTFLFSVGNPAVFGESSWLSSFYWNFSIRLTPSPSKKDFLNGPTFFSLSPIRGWFLWGVPYQGEGPGKGLCLISWTMMTMYTCYSIAGHDWACIFPYGFDFHIPTVSALYHHVWWLGPYFCCKFGTFQLPNRSKDLLHLPTTNGEHCTGGEWKIGQLWEKPPHYLQGNHLHRDISNISHCQGLI